MASRKHYDSGPQTIRTRPSSGVKSDLTSRASSSDFSPALDTIGIERNALTRCAGRNPLNACA